MTVAEYIALARRRAATLPWMRDRAVYLSVAMRTYRPGHV